VRFPNKEFVQTKGYVCPYLIQKGIQSGGEGAGCGTEVLSQRQGEEAGVWNRLAGGG